MKKILCLTLGLGLLSGCYSIETDMDKAKAQRDENRAAVKASEGCREIYDNDAYRKCLLTTYNNSTPKTFTPETLTDGRPIAVISNRKGATPDNPIELQTKPTASIEPVTAEVEALPVSAQATIQPKPCRQEIYEAELPVKQVVVPCDKPSCVPVVTPAPQPVAQPDSWWDTYEQEKAKPVQPEPVIVAPAPVVVDTTPTLVCPCPDPNDPCPQCNEK